MREQDDSLMIETTVADFTKQTGADDLINRYWHWSKKSARAVIEKASSFFDVEGLSDGDEIERFYREVGYRRDDSTSDKYRMIGSRRSRLMECLHLLPDNWTTIYELAKLEDDQFQKLIDGKVLHPKVTMSTIGKQLTAATPNLSSHVGGISSPKRVPFTFDWSQVDAATKTAFARGLKALIDKFEVPVGDKEYATLEAFIDDGQEGDHV